MGTSAPTTGPGAKAAQTFAGYGVNFGVQNGILALIGSLVPETRLDEVREMGVEVAQNLGLGRLMRVALRPLVQTLIATPYTHELNTRYLSVGEQVRDDEPEDDEDDEELQLCSARRPR